jgi:tetratricopeptide (TPR) repeat protein
MLIAQMQLGRMLLDIPDTEGVGSTTAAGQVYRSALALAERLQQQSPGDPLAKRDLGEALSKVGDVLRQQGKVGEAVDHYTRARRLFEELAQSAGAGQMEQRDLSVALVSEAAARVSLGQTDAAKGLLTRAIELRRELARGMDELKTPGNVEALGGLTHALLVLGDLEFDLGDHRQALGVYGEVLSIREKLAMSRPTDRGLQRELANTYERLGLTYHALHDFENAATWQKGCLEIRERLFDQDRRSTLDEFNLSVSYEHLGDLALAMGNLSLARQWYLKLFDIRSRRAGRDAQDAEAQRELAMAHERLAALEQFSGNVKAAMEHYQQDIAIYENLLRRDLTNESLKLELVRQLVKAAQLSATENLLEIAQENYRRSFELLESLPPSMRGEYTAWHLTSSIWLGQADIAQRKGRHAEALAAYEKSRELRNQFAEKFSGNPMALRLLGVAYQRLTHLALGQRRYDDAVRYLADWRELADKFHQQVESIESLLEIAMTQEYEGLLEMERGDYEKALQSFESCRELRQQALDRSPDLADVRKGLATALEQKGLALAAQGKREVALEVLQECFAMRKHLVERSGWSFETTASLIRALDLLAETEVNLVHASQAAEYYAMALEAIESFERATGQNPFTPEFAGFRTMLSRCAVLEKAAGDMEFILQQEEPLRPWLLRYRALALAQQKKFQDAVAAAEVLREIAPRQGVHLFHVARLYARLAEAVEADQGELTPGDQAQRDHFRQQALNALGQSVALGFYDGRQMERESDFARLRELAEFKELVKQAKSAPVVAPDP